MATALQPTDDFSTNFDVKHLELFSLIWLDANADSKDTRNTEPKLRSIINHFKKFHDVKQCQQYIEEKSSNDRLVVVVSGQMGREMVPSIHKLRQVIAIYVYCMDKKRNEEWACKFRKVKAVVVELDELISQIKANHKIQKRVEEPFTINIFTTSGDAGKSTSGVNGEFIFSQVLIDCLLRLKPTQRDKQELITLFQKQYERNSIELNNIREFRQDYSPNKVLWWYSKDSFFYKTLNAALRKRNTHIMFLFRGFIYDIHRQLHKYQSNKPLRVYRSQMLSNGELKTLQQSLGKLISVNSFFSTSATYKKALSFLETSDTSNDLERVLFEIDADPKTVTTRPFADISALSDFTDELEVLFMLGSIFRLKSISRNDNHLWIIRMSLCSDDEHDLKQVFLYMKQQIGNGETNLRTLGNILGTMGKPDLAVIYFKRLVDELPPNDLSRGNLYEELGKLASQARDYDMSVQWHQKALEFKKQHQSAINPGVNKSYSYTEVQEFAAPGTYKPLDCKGRHCAKCGKCRDWYYTGDLTSWKWIQNWKHWKDTDWKRYHDDKVSGRFKCRDGYTCVFPFALEHIHRDHHHHHHHHHGDHPIPTPAPNVPTPRPPAPYVPIPPPNVPTPHPPASYVPTPGPPAPYVPPPPPPFYVPPPPPPAFYVPTPSPPAPVVPYVPPTVPVAPYYPVVPYVDSVAPNFNPLLVPNVPLVYPQHGHHGHHSHHGHHGHHVFHIHHVHSHPDTF